MLCTVRKTLVKGIMMGTGTTQWVSEIRHNSIQHAQLGICRQGTVRGSEDRKLPSRNTGGMEDSANSNLIGFLLKAAAAIRCHLGDIESGGF